MRYQSTRDVSRSVSGAEAIVRGLANDGGLYVPDAIPRLTAAELLKLIQLGYSDLAFCITKLFLPEFSETEIYDLTKSAYGSQFESGDPAPMVTFGDFSFLELWHGPTCAFKDIALQYLPRLLTASLEWVGETKRVTILVATSGDTGKAALEGFRDVEGTSVTVFYPRDGVSDVQKLQMTTQEGSNVRVCAVDGNFDDVQTGVKNLFSDVILRDELDRKGILLSSANSINWGRLLPQIVYYFHAYASLVRYGKIKPDDKVNFCVPTGNFGNILAGYLAREMGLPVNRLICASNDNNVLADFFETGVYNRERELKLTTSPSMDILISSN
ncbi:MAG: threonine synthase, partial [Oscillospiraceae bacterium]|nr:threonine synthase [Oscillospiraceae bacterium]